jgi:exopolyphosphatase/guanosine-5'-triphosphate,3'-diphosphate pyrophosphatase
MNIASIDVGSNSVLLLTSKVNLFNQKIEKPITYYATPRISEGITKTGKINEEKVGKLFKILSEYEKVIHSEKIEKVLVTATKAFRLANNARKITSEIEDRFGWKTNIVSGDDEARLTFFGTTYPFTDSGKSKIVIDIGGGSTEIVIGNQLKIRYKNSFSVGVVSLTEKHFINGIATELELDKAKNEIDSLFKILPKALNDIDSAISVAGTPTTLACIKLGIRDFDEKLVDGFVLSLDDILSIRMKLVTMTPFEILSEYGSVVEGREDVLLSGILILEGAMKSLCLETITVSTKGLRYGAIYNYLGWI